MMVMLQEICVFHECWRHFLRPFIENKNASVILYCDGKARQTLHSVGAFLGNQQVLHIVNIQHIDDFNHIVHIVHI